jgi:hypothetical protein
MNEHFFTLKRSLSWCSLILSASTLVMAPGAALAQTSLSWARIEFLRNRVQLIPQGRSSRAARLSDIMAVGDALRTASASRAELRFNDGSLARIGERAIFRFTPNTRNFQLSNGTMLLLIPPGRGRTTIQTPNAVTGIQGSALFVRTIPETNTTIVGALTNNVQGPMVVYCTNDVAPTPLFAGQMAVIENCQTQVYDFDLQTFYETSGLVEGLRLDETDANLASDELNGVRQEILDALEQQGSFEEGETVENPAFLSPPEVSSGSLAEDLTDGLFPNFENSTAQRFHSVPTVAVPAQTVGNQRSTVTNIRTGVSGYPTLEELDTSRIANQLSGNRPTGNSLPSTVTIPTASTSVPSSTPSSTVATTSPPPSGVVPVTPQTPTLETTLPVTGETPSTNVPANNPVGINQPPASQPSLPSAPAPSTPPTVPTSPTTTVQPPTISPTTPVVTNPGTSPGEIPAPDSTIPDSTIIERPSDTPLPVEQPEWEGADLEGGLPGITPDAVSVPGP